MEQFVQMLLTAAGGGGVTGTIILVLVKHYLAQERDQRIALVAKVESLEKEKLVRLERTFDDRISGLHRKVENHIACDNSQAILTKLQEMEKISAERQKRMDCTLEILTAKIDRSLQINEGQERDIRNLQKHVDGCTYRRK